MQSQLDFHQRWVAPSNFDDTKLNLDDRFFSSQFSGQLAFGPKDQTLQHPPVKPVQRALPIRVSQPASQTSQRGSRSGMGHFEKTEHQLRRKTPNGTIDAGYDGSPMIPGAPPLKHVIIPAGHGSHFKPDVPRQLNQGQTSNPWAAPVQTYNGTWMGAPAAPGYRVASHPFHQGDVQGQPTPIHNNPAMLDPTYPPARPVDATYLSPLGRLPENYGRVAVQYPIETPSQRLNHDLHGYPSQISPCDPPRYLPMPLLWPRPEDPMSVARNCDNPGMLGSPGFLQSAHLNLETLTMDQGGYGHVLGQNPHRFQHKALSQAHRVYLELLSHQRRGKIKPGAVNGVSKTFIFPKLPKQFTVAKEAFPGGHAPRHDPHSHSRLSMTELRHPHSSSGHGAMPHIPSQTMSPLTLSTPDRYSGDFTPPDLAPKLFSLASAARASLEMLSHLCEQNDWKWIDGILIGGCLYYGLEDYTGALDWFSKILVLNPSHVEGLLNTAATFYSLGRQEEAEKHWLDAIKAHPYCLEAVEHLVGTLYKKRNTEAIDIISYIQRSLRTRAPPPNGNGPSNGHPITHGSSGVSQQQWLDGDGHVSPDCPGFGSSGYSIPGSDSGRMLALIHAKGTMLYSLKDVKGAAEAFEEAVLISTGRGVSCIADLVRKIQQVLSLDSGQSVFPGQPVDTSSLLLPPHRARHTASLVFPSSGELPGLRFVPDGVSRRAAIQTTSNSLLSLAKIFQDAMSTGTVATQPLSGVGDILALYYLSLSLQESPSTANNVGILLAGVQQPTTSMPQPHQLPRPSSLQSIPGITPGSGLSLALAYYEYGLTLDENHVHLHTNLGSLLKDIGQLDTAIAMYSRAVECDGKFDIALTNLANAVKDRGKIGEAIGYYKRAVLSNPDFAEAVCGLTTALNSVCDWRGRGGVLLLGGKYDRWHVDDQGMLSDVRDHRQGSGLMNRVVEIVKRQLNESSGWGWGVLKDFVPSVSSDIRRLAHVIDGAPPDADPGLMSWSKKPWEGTRLVRLIERATRAMMWLWYRDRYTRNSGSVGSQSGYQRLRLPGALAVPTAPTVLPFHTFTYPLTARAIRLISQRNALRISCSTLKAPWLPPTVYPPPRPPNPQLRVGYVSSDFNNHPLAHLMQSVFGFHDPSKVKAYCYATTASDASIHRQKIEREAPVFRDVSGWASDKLLGQIIEDGIHILVNLNGYTRGARNEIFAARPCPIQMSFMGFAGTLGAEWCDYILADTTAIPPSTLRPWRSNRGITDIFRDGNEDEESDWVYSENIIFCRDTFFCCDHAQSSVSENPRATWNEEQQRRWEMRKSLFPNLPDDAVILGNFNQLYKMDPTTFRSWLRILSHAPKAILWLLRFPELGEANLRRTALEWAGAHVANRIIFTDVAPKSQHIARARVCDLFLDTPECNAHTTAADVLWGSTPLLTLPRYPYKMCSRMAASILKGALPKTEDGARAAEELIADSEEEYERTAVELANGLSYEVSAEGYGAGQGRLAELRRLLYESRWTCALFDTHRWVGDLERAYEEAWRRWVAGEAGDIYL